ncbi:MAG: ATPase [Desulfuromonadales bacterium C00003094]|jgi:MoxR-like ATPase|nr:MAG: ATPase [Desulfuromonadales bacterium C00003094]
MTSTTQSPNADTHSRSESFRRQLQQAETEISKVIIGQQEMIQIIFCALLAKGHVLLEGVPGLAKSLTVATFARLIGGTFKRIQFTPDKLPSDITGTTVYNQATSTFSFNQGPVFCNILLADEINRAAPKVQSALLEAMQEKVVSIDRDQHPLPDLFMVLATMNPVEQLGTYPLSEAQLDRFIAKVELSYPAQADEADLLHKKSRNFEALQKAVPQLLTTTQALAMQNHVATEIKVSERVIAYLLEICLRTRPQSIHASSRVSRYITVGVSPRGGEHLIAFCKGRAFLQGRDFVSFEDVDASAATVLGHRLILSDAAFLEGVRPAELLGEIISGIALY